MSTGAEMLDIAAGEVTPGFDVQPEAGAAVDGETEFAHDTVAGGAAGWVGDEAAGDGEDVHEFSHMRLLLGGDLRWRLEPLFATIQPERCMSIPLYKSTVSPESSARSNPAAQPGSVSAQSFRSNPAGVVTIIGSNP